MFIYCVLLFVLVVDIGSILEKNTVRPPPPTLSAVKTGRFQSTIDGITLICQGVGTGVGYFWFYLNGELLETGRSDTFYRTVTTPELSGLYTCTFSNAYGESPPSNRVHITFIEPPTLTPGQSDYRLGDNLSLSCSTNVRAFRIAYSWYRNDELLFVSTSPKALIQNLTIKNGGVYGCTFQFNNFTSSRSNQVFVILSIPDKPVLSSSASRVRRGQPVQFQCTASSKADYTSSWSTLYHYGKAQKISTAEFSRQGNNFSEISLMSTANLYTCTISNSKGESEESNPKYFQVIPFFPDAPIVKEATFILDYDRRSPVALTKPSIWSAPVTYLTLYKDGQKFKEVSGNLEFNFDRKISGTYTIDATNYDGASHRTLPSLFIAFYSRPEVMPVTRGSPKVSKHYFLTCKHDIKNGAVEWLRSDLTRVATGRALTVTIDENRASYDFRCNVTFQINNRTTWKISEAFLFYSVTPTKPTLTVLGNYEAPLNLTLTCTGNYGASFTVYRGGAKMVESPDLKTLQWTRLPGLGAWFSCSLTNNVGESSQSDPVYIPGRNELSILSSQPVPHIHQPLTLTCQINRKLTNVSYSWIVYRKSANGVAEIITNQTLSLKSLSAEDQGLYFCRIHSSNQIIYAQNNYIIAFYKPRAPLLRVISTSQERVSQNWLTVMCSSHDLLTDMYSSFRIYKDNKLVKLRRLSSPMVVMGNDLYLSKMYIINTSRPESWGNYTCRAVNPVAESEPSAPISILPTTDIVQPTINASDPSPLLGKALSLICNVPKFVFDYQVTWWKDFSKKMFTGRAFYLGLLEEEDDGVYVCSYKVSAWDSAAKMSPPFILALINPLLPTITFAGHDESSDTTEQTVLSDFHKFSAGQTIRLRCTAVYRTVDPASEEQTLLKDAHKSLKKMFHYSLFRNGQAYDAKGSDGLYDVTGLPLGEHNFSCKVNNGFSNSDMSYPLLVIVTTKVTITVTNSSPGLGSSLIFTCNTSDVSNGRDIIWRKNGRLLIEKSSSLSLTNVTEFDEGSYTCQQTESIWTLPLSEPFIISFLVPASHPDIIMTDDVAGDSDSIKSLMCVSRSSTSDQAKFYKNNQLVYSSTDGRINDMGYIEFLFPIQSQESLTGTYSCSVQNKFVVSQKSSSLVIDINTR